MKCPQSAPPKPPRARFARLSADTEAAEKAPAKPKPMVQRICALRASPVRTKAARVECPSERKKALTTPRSKPVRPRPELFHSVKHQKEPFAAAARKGTVVKALFMSTPKKEPVRTPAADKGKEAVSEAGSKPRKLNLACREVPSRYMSQLKNPKTPKKGEETTVAKSEKRGQESKTNVKKKILGRSAKCASAEHDGENRNGCSSTAADENSLAETASSNQERNVVLQELRIEVDTSRSDNSDDNKENLSTAAPSEESMNNSHSESENRQLENNENVPLKKNVALKVAKLQSKVHQEQAGKLKKTTNPRPFRLRTDERGVLKEAKPEKRHPFAENNSMAVLKDPNRGPTTMDKHIHGKGLDKPTCGKKQMKQSTQIVTGQQQLVGESRPAFNSTKCKAVKPQTVSRVAASSSARTAKTASGLVAPSRVGKERKATVKLSRFQTTVA